MGHRAFRFCQILPAPAKALAYWHKNNTIKKDTNIWVVANIFF